MMMISTLALACDRDGSDADSDGDEESDEKGNEGDKKKSAKAKNDDGSIPAPEPGDMPALKVGAWSKYRMSTGKVTFAVVERRNDTEYLIDAKVEGPMPILMQAWIDAPDMRDSKGLKMKEARAKIGAGAIQNVQFGAKSPAALSFEKIMSKIIVQKFEGLPQEDVKVEAGHFRKCYRWRNSNTFMGITVKETIWSHPAVPPPAMVKSEGDDGKGGFELVAYGKSGAKKSF